MFYFDLESQVNAQSSARCSWQRIGDVCEEFRYLGSYSEVL
jgi:prephenate dehydratase